MTTCGRSIGSMCPVAGTTVSRAPGIAAASRRACPSGVSLSRPEATTSTSTPDRFLSATRLSWVISAGKNPARVALGHAFTISLHSTIAARGALRPNSSQRVCATARREPVACLARTASALAGLAAIFRRVLMSEVRTGLATNSGKPRVSRCQLAAGGVGQQHAGHLAAGRTGRAAGRPAP